MCAHSHTHTRTLAVSAEGAIKLYVLKYYCMCVMRARPPRVYNNAQAKHESGPFIQQPSAVLSHIFGDNTGKQPSKRACCAFLFWRGGQKHFEIISSSPLPPVLIKTIFFLLASGVSVLSHLQDLSRYACLSWSGKVHETDNKPFSCFQNQHFIHFLLWCAEFEQKFLVPFLFLMRHGLLKVFSPN